MRKIPKIITIAIAICAVSYGAWNEVTLDTKEGKPKDGDIPVFTGKGNSIRASNVTEEDMTHVADLAETLSTNTAATLEFKSNKDVPNGYAGLDENGKVSTNAISNIIVIYTGGSAFE